MQSLKYKRKEACGNKTVFSWRLKVLTESTRRRGDGS